MPKPKPMSQGRPVDFQTPESAIYPLLPYLKTSYIVWECAEGKCNISNFLFKKGFHVIGSELNSNTDKEHEMFTNNDVTYNRYFNKDFLTWQPEKFDCIITNPPYNIKQKFLERCYELGKPFALLLPLTTFETQKRQKLFREYGVEVIFLPERVRFETPNGKKEGESSPWFATCWITNGLNIGKQITFWENNKEQKLIE